MGHVIDAAAPLPFVQLEFSHHLGPEAGRYVVREGAEPRDEDVLVVGVEAATRPRTRRLTRPRARPEAVPSAPPELSVTVVTVIRAARRFAGEEEAARWLSDVRASTGEQEVWARDALATLNRAVGAYRACAADPYAIDVSRADARVVRIGYGSAGELVRGRWDAAIAIPAPPAPRLDRAVRLMPTEGMAAVLGGRARTLESEELLLRVVLDLEHGRFRAAAAGLCAAHDLLAGELADEVLGGPVADRFDRVLASRDATGALAERGLAGPLDEEDVQRLRELAEQAGALVDAWRYVPVGAGTISRGAAGPDSASGMVE
jgi:hypothetical protein